MFVEAGFIFRSAMIWHFLFLPKPSGWNTKMRVCVCVLNTCTKREKEQPDCISCFAYSKKKVIKNDLCHSYFKFLVPWCVARTITATNTHTHHSEKSFAFQTSWNDWFVNWQKNYNICMTKWYASIHNAHSKQIIILRWSCLSRTQKVSRLATILQIFSHVTYEFITWTQPSCYSFFFAQHDS